ncbi:MULTISPECIES: S16 family serine protease [unclassified Candidatus Tisiphia]|uniref:S16 family serine protease n=1 Tax=unclassified Candidatus Tisiphia TaxID=2996318 RepID=UPI00312CAC5A
MAVLTYGLKQYQAVIDICNQHPCICDILPVCSGDAYYGLEKYDEAINYYSKIEIVDSKKYIYSRYNIGLAYYKLGNYLESTKSFDEVLKLNEGAEQRIPNVLNESVLYKLSYDDFTDVQENQLKNIEDVLIINPQSISALLIKMRFLIQLGKYDEALNVNRKLLAFSSDNPTLIYYQGIIFHKLERNEEALEYIVKAIALNENPRKEWLRDKAIILFHLEKYQEAIVEYDKILSQEPKNHIILAYKASALVEVKKYDEALKLLEDVLDMYPTYIDAITRKGSVYFEMGNYQEAVKNYDKAIQLGENSSKVIYFRELAIEELRKLAIEEDLAYLIENTPLPPTVKIQATVKLNSIKSLNNTDNERNDHIRYLQNVLKLPWGKYDNTNIDLTKAKEVLEQEHYGLEEVKTRIIEALVFMTRSTDARPPIICLVGSPGVGKTSIANSVAAALQRKSVTLSLAGAQDTHIIRGCMTFYRGATPGKVLTLISEAGTCNPVMVLDEIDKMDSSRGNNLEGALLQLIDPSQNSHFTDDYFNFPFDLSKVLFIITANSLDRISYPLLNRMEVIEISGYTEQEKLQIANNYLIPKLLNEANLPIEQFKIDETIINKLIKHYTKESGVRDIERILRTIVQKYLVDELQGNKPMIDLALIEQYLGTAKYQDTNPDKTAKVGIAIGLAYTASGGSTITVETEKFPGEGKIKATGKLGEVLKESIEAALAYLKANAQQLAIEQQLFKKYDLHLHLPEGAIAKDGPSAGITIFVALASLLSGKKVRQDIAMTGELTLKGRILPIGGLKEKLSAAVRENITTVIIPEGNKRDLAKIPHEIRGILAIKTISHASELLDIIFVNKK